MFKLNLKWLFLLGMVASWSFAWSEVRTQNLADAKWQFRKKGDSTWLSASVPGNVHTDLMKHGLITDPFMQANESKVQWVGEADWEYKCSFELRKEEALKNHIELSFENLDTYAKISINGKQIEETNNQFRTWTYDVKQWLHVGQNTLHIELLSVLKKGNEQAKKYSYPLPGGDAIWTRKAQYQYGWDWGPRLLTCGIDKVSLCFWQEAKIQNLQTNYVIHSDTSATVNMFVNIASDKAQEAKVRVLFQDIPGMQLNRDIKQYLKSGTNQLHISFKIPKVRLWWSNGLGEAFLYKLSISLEIAKKEHANYPVKIGFRTIEICQTPDSLGSEFSFKINGKKVFIKGSNYIPPHSFLNGLNQSTYKDLVEEAKSTHMNMLRVWGGGVYAADAFYEACDENGILVWQDFMFACAMYPGDEAFIANVKKEAEDQVKRLRNHPSLSIWCGNNEVDEAWKNWGWQKQYGYSFGDSSEIANAYHRLFVKTLGEVIKQEDIGRFYWPSSPSIGWGRPQSLLQGDMHYWGVWWGMEPFEKYEQKVGRFMSEYGFQGMPSLHTYKQFMNTKAEEFDSTSYKQHQKHGTGYETINTYLERDYDKPKTFENFIYTSQLVQARGMQIAIEAHRRAKPYCMGTLYWQLNDCWPVSSWSSVDFYGRKKAFHYQLKRLYAEQLISFKKQGDSVLVYVITDKQESSTGRLRMRLLTFDGRILKTLEKELMLEANSSAVKGVWFEPNLPDFDAKKNVLQVEFISKDDTVMGLHYFVNPKNLALPNAQLTMTLKGNSLLLRSDVLVKDLYLDTEDGRYTFSDNYFDLLPGEEKWVAVKTDAYDKIEVQKIRFTNLNKKL
jgi:beta-mannosidase